MKLYAFAPSELFDVNNKDKMLTHFKIIPQVRMFKSKDDALRAATIFRGSESKIAIAEFNTDVTEDELAHFKTTEFETNEGLVVAYKIDSHRCTLVKASIADSEDITFMQKTEAEQNIERLQVLLSEKPSEQPLTDVDFAEIGRVVVALGGRKVLSKVLKTQKQESQLTTQTSQSPRI